jgi:hypothetical protein
MSSSSQCHVTVRVKAVNGRGDRTYARSSHRLQCLLGSRGAAQAHFIVVMSDSEQREHDHLRRTIGTKEVGPA